MGINIKTVEIRNFFSYGDYITKLDIGDLGPTLIMGQLDGCSEDSNGVGKTTVSSAILWCLFGRLFDQARPGDKVVNWLVNKNCYVRITTKNGWVITRTRKYKGHDDLIVYKDGKDKTRSTNTAAQEFILEEFGLDYDIFVSSVFFGQFSKPFMEMSDSVRKSTLERLLGVNKLNAWAESARLKYNHADAASDTNKVRLEDKKRLLESIKDQIATNEGRAKEYESSNAQHVVQLKKEISTLEDEISKFEKEVAPDLNANAEKWEKIEKLKEKLTEYQNEYDALNSQLETQERLKRNILHDHERAIKNAKELEKYEWDVLRAENDKYDKNKKVLDKIENYIRGKNREILEHNEIIKYGERITSAWKSKSDSVCSECEQPISAGHVASVVGPHKEKAEKAKEQVEKLKAEISAINKKKSLVDLTPPTMSRVRIDTLQKEYNDYVNQQEDLIKKAQGLSDIITDLKKNLLKVERTRNLVANTIKKEAPKKSQHEIKSLVNYINGERSRLSRLKNELNSRDKKENPYKSVIADLHGQINEVEKEIEIINDEVEKKISEARHYHYLWRAYKDRNKIKSMLLGELVPYLNNRMMYYLEAFGCSIRPKFTKTLGIKSNKWGYLNCSGGQRKRIDVSIAFAIHDLHLAMYGRQCNLMLFDEVDSRLDTTGVESFIRIIMDDIADRNNEAMPGPDTIMVVSHKEEMRDAFPSAILVSGTTVGDNDILSKAEVIQT